jgi:hypothetical protein
MLYARLGLGEKIKACVEEKGQCEFDADYYWLWQFTLEP